MPRKPSKPSIAPQAAKPHGKAKGPPTVPPPASGVGTPTAPVPSPPSTVDLSTPGGRLKAVATRLGLSQSAFGKLLGVSRARIGNIYQGRKDAKATLDWIYEAARTLGIDPSELDDRLASNKRGRGKAPKGKTLKAATAPMVASPPSADLSAIFAEAIAWMDASDPAMLKSFRGRLRSGHFGQMTPAECGLVAWLATLLLDAIDVTA